MIKILFDFVPADTLPNSPYYEIDKACREEIDYYVYEKKCYQNLFDRQYQITSGTLLEKNQRLEDILEEIARIYHGETIYMHFLGHGVKDMVGLQFVRYEDLSRWLLPIRESNIILLNMMSSCYSVGMTHYRECYNVLWHSIDEVQDYCASFDFMIYYLQEDGSANFEEFIYKMGLEVLREDRT